MNNPPAFPSSNEVTLNDWVSSGHSGMTLRDYMAAKAMQGTLAGLLAYGHDIMCNYIAEDAYKQADAMMKAREE
jgi:hypothetical protein